MADVNRRGFFAGLLAVVASPLALMPWWMRSGTRPHTTGQLFKAGDVLVIDQAGVHNVGPLRFHPDAFAFVIKPIQFDISPLEHCHVCGSPAALTSGGMWHCAKCEHAWLSGYGVIKGEST